MKFALISDLHLDVNADNGFSPEIIIDLIDRYKKKPDAAENLIIAGDIADGTPLVISALETIGKSFSNVIYVDGNHDFYGMNMPMSQVEETLSDYFDYHNNVCYMTTENHLLLMDDKVAVIGTNGWYDWNFPGCGDKNIQKAAWDVLSNDKHVFKNPGNYPMPDVLASEAARVVRNRLKELIDSKLQDKYKVLVVTHTVPHEKAIQVKPDNPLFAINGSFYNSMMQSILDDPQLSIHIKAWCFGHTHVPFFNNVNGVQLFCNPYGNRKNKFGMSNTSYGIVEFDINNPSEYYYFQTL